MEMPGPSDIRAIELPRLVLSAGIAECTIPPDKVTREGRCRNRRNGKYEAIRIYRQSTDGPATDKEALYETHISV